MNEEASEQFDYEGGAAVLAVREGDLIELLPAFAEDPFNKDVQGSLRVLLESEQLARATTFVERYRNVAPAKGVA